MNRVNFYPLDRRSSERIMTSLSLKYRMNGESIFWQEARLKDLSETGLRFTSPTNGFYPGSPIEVSLKLPDSSEEAKLEGTVVWTRPNHIETECGVSFQAKRRHPLKERMVQFLADRMAELVCHRASKTFTVSCLRNKKELKDSMRLLYREYVRRGYLKEDPSGLHYTQYSLNSKTEIFVLREKSAVVGTVSLIPNSPMGLPMESIFADETGRIRKQRRRKIAEVSLLAVDSRHFGRNHFSLTSLKKFQASFLLFKAVFNAVREKRITDLVIAVHPKHEALYRYLHFEVMGPVKLYPEACGKLALPMRLNLKKAVQSTSPASGIGLYFLNGNTPEDKPEKKYNLSMLEARKLLFETKPLWRRIPIPHLAYLKDRYPGLMEHMKCSAEKGNPYENQDKSPGQ